MGGLVGGVTRRGVNKSVRAPVGLWEALHREATAFGLSSNGYVVQRLREAVEADYADRRRRELLELERERLRLAGQGIYGS